ncbi:DUF4307 domain-containing protein [Streptomyces boncukensis]|uniref:DUF4307 domain-containing protein n=1 Tax=Streptomyces boncukensis TaxID=2711219 RepID=A0A6G4WW69_9ACTN|nr:DUF4307 domain-containing protein [Streptomyces boncukensis]NGO69102.1 DUF4307 domain-containing protein [Streptomyces boncukensis]
MGEEHQGVPAGRYGRRSGGYGAGGDARTDRRLKLVGAVLGAALLGVVAWFGVSYITGKDVSGELIKYKVVSDREVEVHLEVRKDAGVTGVCTLRARSEDGAEVGRKAVTVESGPGRVDKVVGMRTTGRATGAELVGCEKGQ